MPNYDRKFNGKGFPFKYTPSNRAYIPMNVTNAPNGASVYQNRAMAENSAHHYYKFIDKNLPKLEDRFIFLKAILSSDTYRRHDEDFPILFLDTLPPQPFPGYGFKISSNQRVTLPETMSINPVSLARDFLRQFPELNQKYGEILRASTSDPTIQKFFSDDYVKDMLLSKEARELIILFQRVPQPNDWFYDLRLKEVGSKIIHMVQKQDTNSFWLIEKYLKEEPGIMDKMFEGYSTVSIEGALNTLSALGPQGKPLFDLFYEDIWRVLSSIDFTDYQRLKEDKELILSKISADGLSEALRRGRVNDNTLISLKELGIAPDEAFVRQWLHETEYSKNWVAVGLALQAHFPQLLQNISSQGLTGEKVIFVEKVLTSHPSKERSAEYIYANLPRQEQLTQSLESIRQELEQTGVGYDSFALYRENIDKFTGDGLLDPDVIEELQALKNTLPHLNTLVLEVDSLLQQNGPGDRQTALNNLKTELLNEKSLDTFSFSLASRATQIIEDIRTVDNLIQRLNDLKTGLSPQNQKITEQVIQDITGEYYAPAQVSAYCQRLEEAELFTRLQEFYRLSDLILSEEFKQNIKNTAEYDVLQKLALDPFESLAAFDTEELLNKLPKLTKFIAIHQLAANECNQAILDSIKDSALDLLDKDSPDTLAAMEKLLTQAEQITRDFKLTEPSHLTERQKKIHAEIVSGLASAFSDADSCLNFITRNDNGLQQFQTELTERITNIQSIDAELDKPDVKAQWEKGYLELRNKLLTSPHSTSETFKQDFDNLKNMRELKNAMTTFSGRNNSLQQEVNTLFSTNLVSADKPRVTDASIKILDDFLNAELHTYTQAKHSGVFFKQSQQRVNIIEKLHAQIKDIINTPSDESYAYRIAKALRQAERETVQDHYKNTIKFFGIALTKSRLADTLHKAIDHMASNGQINKEELESLEQEENSGKMSSP
ncbi:hypothetical protein Lqui_0044 [Legionella quinlivanii]|uniref:Uncharacterized protein n=1 Tax=Legionella quinlivanii TaxID=45073 RepID=A0A0W0Y7Y8_9GAMM|nr:hypothetical protein [Legionella quinlivanii]KTD53089.1 hypothetical protein Lqui_0044 [Legionella quinlivanii]SEG17231.1 hypothetical protein SAMN02746093_02087 [Legionella quinlivanii DSM 21216]STY10470.1 Uncharacterised protein [Legionella quinlivanii]